MRVRVQCPVFILWCIACLSGCQSANILVLEGFPSPSHHVWMRALTTELVRRGHNVTSLSCDIESSPPANLHYIHLDQVYAQVYADDSDLVKTIGESSAWQNLLVFYQLNKAILEGTIKSKGFQTLLDYPDDFKFDLIIHDYLTGSTPAVFLDKFYKVPLISASAYPLIYGTNHLSAAPMFPAFIPSQYLKAYDSGFVERVENFLLMWFEYVMENYCLRHFAEKAFAKYNLSHSIEELLHRSKLVLVNYSPVTSYVQPIMPNIIPVGGLQIRDPQPLPDDLRQIYEASGKVVFFSLGTNIKARQLGSTRLSEFIATFRLLPQYTFLWKLDTDGIDLDIPNNVHVRKWFSQTDILAQNKTVLFMTHGGGLSAQETTHFGVPFIGFPVFLDQFMNIDIIVEGGFGIKYDLWSVNRDSLRKAIQEVVENEKYAKQARIKSANFRGHPQTPMERAMWHIDYVMQNPDISYLKNERLANLSAFTKASLDVIAFLGLAALSIVWVFYRMFKCVHRRTDRSRSAHAKSAKKAKTS